MRTIRDKNQNVIIDCDLQSIFLYMRRDFLKESSKGCHLTLPAQKEKL